MSITRKTKEHPANEVHVVYPKSVEALQRFQMLTARGVAEILPFTTDTIRKWIHDGRIRSVKIGKTKQSRRLVPLRWLIEDLGLPELTPPRTTRAQIEQDMAIAEAELAAVREVVLGLRSHDSRNIEGEENDEKKTK